jgi:hypothetical protein
MINPFRKQIDNYYEMLQWTFTIENGKLKKLERKIWDISSLYPTVMGKPWRDK